MKEKYLPVIVTTKEALAAAMAGNPPVIYVSSELSLSEAEALDGYQKLCEPGRKGLFFIRNGISAGIPEIYDPFGIL